MAFEEVALLRGGSRFKHLGGIDAVQARQNMSGPDKPAEEAETIEVAREQFDPPPSSGSPTVPIGPGGLIEARTQQSVIGKDILARVRFGEEASERFVIRQEA